MTNLFAARTRLQAPGTLEGALRRTDISSPQADRPENLAVELTRRLPGPGVWTFLGFALALGLGAIVVRRLLA